MNLANASIAYESTSPGPTKEAGPSFTTIIPSTNLKKKVSCVTL